MSQVEVKRRQIETCSWVIGLINILLFRKMLGNNGIAYLMIAMECFAFIWTISAGSLSDTLGKMLRSRIGKGQYKNVKNIRRRVLILEGIIGIICSILLMSCAGVFAQSVFKVPHSTFIMTILAPALFMRMVSTVLIGCSQGEGSELPAVVAAPLRQLLIMGFGLLFANVLGDYGVKVSNLLGDTAYTAMYSAVGVAIAVDLAELLVLVFLSLITVGNKHSVLKRDNEGMKQTDSMLSTVKILYGSMWMLILLQLFEMLPIWIGTVFYRKSVADIESFADNLGMFTGCFVVLCGIPVVLVCALLISLIAKTASNLRKEDNRGAKITFQSGLHVGVVHALFFSAYVAIMAEQLAGVVSGTNANLVADLLRSGSVLILLIVLFYYFTRLLLRMGRKYELMGCLGVMDIVFIIVLSMLLNGGNTGIMSLIYAAIAALGVCVLASGFLCCKRLHTGIEWLQIIAIPVGAACISGLVIMFLGNVLTPHLGNLVTAFVCFVLSFLVYWVLLLLFRSFREQELKNIPGGGIIRAAGQTLRVFDMD